MVLAALVGVVLPGHFFAGIPHGTVSHQIWAVALKLAGSYVLVVGSWVLLLAWAAVLLSREHGARRGAAMTRRAGSGGLRPAGEDSVQLPLPESGDDAGGNT